MFRKGFVKNNRGEIIVENVIFIVLNLVFLSILVLFLVNQSSGVVLLERPYAKQIALLADSARPGMVMEINMVKAMKLAKKNKINFEDVIKIEDNFVIVKLSSNSGKGYSFFNDLDVRAFPAIVEETGEYTGNYILTFSKKFALVEENNEI